MTFADEFSSSTLDSKKWSTTLRYGDRFLSGNSELECYMDGNISISGGYLNLTAKKQSVSCAKPVKTQNYTSGAIASFDKFSQAYGYFEMRAKLPAGKGLWPAFWLLPQSGHWPPEIDIFEQLGKQPNRIYSTYHYLVSGVHKQDSSYVDLTSATTAYHTYGADWSSGVIVWYIDGKEVKRDTNFVTSEPMYILANLAVGGSWPGSPDSTTPFPSSMVVDYIRVYERVNNGLSDTKPPFGGKVSVSLTQPVSGQSALPQTMISLAANPINASRVIFYAGTTKVCEVNSAPFKCNYTTPSTAGSVTIHATAISASGVSASSGSVSLNVGASSAKPVVKIVQPSLNQIMPAAKWTTLSVSATNAVKVEILINNKLFCTVTKAPYNCSYQTPSIKTTVDVKARAYPSSGPYVEAHSTFLVQP
jgi:beta-glucanase (GH16 family)